MTDSEKEMENNSRDWIRDQKGAGFDFDVQIDSKITLNYQRFCGPQVCGRRQFRLFLSKRKPQNNTI